MKAITFTHKKCLIGILALLNVAVAPVLLSEEARIPLYQTPGEIEIVHTTTSAPKLVRTNGGTLVSPGNAEKKIIAKGFAFNVRVKQSESGVAVTYLDQYGEPLEDQEKWSALAAGAPLPVPGTMFFSDGCPSPAGYGESMTVWQVTSLNYGTYWETTYRTGFSGNAEYFTHAFTADGSYTLTANLFGPMSVAVSSDDNATLSVGGVASCSSSLHVPGSATGTFPDGTSSAAIGWTYENIGGPHSLNIQFVVRRN